MLFFFALYLQDIYFRIFLDAKQLILVVIFILIDTINFLPILIILIMGNLLLFNKLFAQVRFLIIGVSIFVTALSANANNSLKINIVDVNQKPLENMVVYLEAVDHKITKKNSSTLEVGQKYKSFTPYISVMQLGYPLLH